MIEDPIHNGPHGSYYTTLKLLLFEFCIFQSIKMLRIVNINILNLYMNEVNVTLIMFFSSIVRSFMNTLNIHD